jgi:hypothetical protein
MNRQLASKRKLLQCGHTIVTTATVAEVLLERAIACREVGIIVSGVVRVCHGDCLYVAVLDDGYKSTELVVVAYENDQGPD